MNAETFVQNGQRAQAAADAVVSTLERDPGVAVKKEPDRIPLTALAPVSMLTPEEKTHYEFYKAEARAGLKAAQKFLEAIANIRERRLYRAEYNTFEDFCREELGFTARRARQLISSADILKTLESGNTVSTFVLPANDRQILPLGLLPAEQQTAAWVEAVNTAPGGHVTARHVQSVVDRIRGKERGVHTASPSTNGSGVRRDESRAPRIHDAGTRAEQIMASVDAAIARTRDLLDQIGTADSVATTDVTDALRKLDNFREHLTRVEKLKEARI